MATKNDITGDSLISKQNNENFNKGFDGIDFSKKLVLCDICGKDMDQVATCDKTQCSKFWDEKRADTIGSNGNIGYEPE